MPICLWSKVGEIRPGDNDIFTCACSLWWTNHKYIQLLHINSYYWWMRSVCRYVMHIIVISWITCFPAYPTWPLAFSHPPNCLLVSVSALLQDWNAQRLQQHLAICLRKGNLILFSIYYLPSICKVLKPIPMSTMKTRSEPPLTSGYECKLVTVIHPHPALLVIKNSFLPFYFHLHWHCFLYLKKNHPNPLVCWLCFS